MTPHDRNLQSHGFALCSSLNNFPFARVHYISFSQSHKVAISGKLHEKLTDARIHICEKRNARKLVISVKYFSCEFYVVSFPSVMKFR